MQIKSLMTKRVVSVDMDDTLATIKGIFEHMYFHHVLVIEKAKLLGVISDRDLFKALSPNLGQASENEHDTATLKKRVHQIMTRKPITVRGDNDVYDAIALFNQHSISCLPVLDEDQKVIGILTWRDILRALEARQKRKLSSQQ
tara:strand:+ start:1543 stop:1974 length:432 start_codon:yes stop_codon:yes gene_type:complete